MQQLAAIYLDLLNSPNKSNKLTSVIRFCQQSIDYNYGKNPFFFQIKRARSN